MHTVCIELAPSTSTGNRAKRKKPASLPATKWPRHRNAEVAKLGRPKNPRPPPIRSARATSPAPQQPTAELLPQNVETTREACRQKAPRGSGRPRTQSTGTHPRCTHHDDSTQIKKCPRRTARLKTRVGGDAPRPSDWPRRPHHRGGCARRTRKWAAERAGFVRRRLSLTATRVGSMTSDDTCTIASFGSAVLRNATVAGFLMPFGLSFRVCVFATRRGSWWRCGDAARPLDADGTKDASTASVRLTVTQAAFVRDAAHGGCVLTAEKSLTDLTSDKTPINANVQSSKVTTIICNYIIANDQQEKDTAKPKSNSPIVGAATKKNIASEQYAKTITNNTNKKHNKINWKRWQKNWRPSTPLKKAKLKLNGGAVGRRNGTRAGGTYAFKYWSDRFGCPRSFAPSKMWVTGDIHVPSSRPWHTCYV